MRAHPFWGVLSLVTAFYCGFAPGRSNAQTKSFHDSRSRSATATVNQPPLASSYRGVSYLKQEFRFHASPLPGFDPDGDPLTYRIVSGTLPAGLTLDPETGVISGKPTAMTRGTSFTYQADDGQELSEVQEGLIVIQEAQSYVVNTPLDQKPDADSNFDGLTSLRDAITLANLGIGPAIAPVIPVTFALPPGRRTINLREALPPLNRNLSITGPTTGGGVTVKLLPSAPVNGESHIFSMMARIVNLSNLTISGGNALLYSGGGIFNYGGHLTLTNCTLTGNSSGIGGALYSNCPSGFLENESRTPGFSRLINCTLVNNTATIVGAPQQEGGGAIFNADGPVYLESCTITGNRSPKGTGAGISLSGVGATLHINNSIIAGNSSGSVNPTAEMDLVVRVDELGAAPAVFSEGHNLIGDGRVGDEDAAAYFTAAGDLYGIADSDLKIGDLTDNGGPTPTIALGAGSPAVDAGSTSLNTDQRGSLRPQGSAKDIGAYEGAIEKLFSLSSLKLTPESPLTDDTLTAEAEAVSPYGGPVSFKYQWERRRDGKTTVLQESSNKLSAVGSEVSLGDVITVRVTAYDGPYSSTPQSRNVTIGNAPISITSVKLTPSAPYTNDKLVVTVETADADKTPAYYNYFWFKNEQLVRRTVGSRKGQDTLDLGIAGHGDKGDHIFVQVHVRDVADASVSALLAQAGTTVLNSVPVSTVFTLTPAAPTPTNVVTAVIGGRDGDGDKLTRIYKWKVGKKVLVEEKSMRLNLAKYPFVKAGDLVSLEMRLSDGESLSKTRVAQVKVVASTPPAALSAPASSIETSGNAS